MSLPTQPAQDHRVHLMYEFSCDPVAAEAALPTVTLAMAGKSLPGWIHADRLGGERNLANRTLWHWTSWDVSPDLHVFVRRVLNSFTGEPRDAETLCLSLGEEGLSLIAGRYRFPSPRNAEEGKAARGRDRLVFALPRQHDLPEPVLAAMPWLITTPEPGDALGAPLELDSVRLHLFRTGVGLIDVSLRIGRSEKGAFPIDAGVLIAALPRLTHGRRDAVLGWGDSWADEASRISLQDALNAMIAPAGCRPGAWERTYSYCALVYETPIAEPDARDIAFRLSRHYSMRYWPPPDLLGTHFVAPFETVLHAASREGGCTLINGTADASGTRAELLATWTRQSHPLVYLPMQIAALHELVALLGMAQDATGRIPASPARALDTATLRALCDRFLVFRLHYRFAQISAITMHDLAFDATARALGLDRLGEKINRDLLAIERRLIEDEREAAQARHAAAERQRAAAREAAQRAHEATERRYALWAGLSSAALAYLTISAVAEHVAQIVPEMGQVEISAHFIIEAGGQGLAFIAAIFGFLYARRHQHQGHSVEDEIIEHQHVERAIAGATEAEASRR